jgi:1-aminocyclopropane-1-carboxylate deaminase/D-cysteine desulfhydrase-like pyridoxal-dependent ACC family enzyme
MNHFSFRPTPIDRLDYLSERLGVNFFVKRGDLFGIAGGVSKARMLQYILQKLKMKMLITSLPPGVLFPISTGFLL